MRAINRREVFKSLFASAALATGLARTTLAMVISERTVKIPYVAGFDTEFSWIGPSVLQQTPQPIFGCVEFDALEVERLSMSEIQEIINAASRRASMGYGE